jgi:peptidyl-prolyl cis-trans isomerase D
MLPLSHPILPIRDYYQKANDFAAKVTDAETFEAACSTTGMTKRLGEYIREAEWNLPGIDHPREFIRAAYETEKGNVIRNKQDAVVFDAGGKYLVGVVTVVREKGIAPSRKHTEGNGSRCTKR